MKKLLIILGALLIISIVFNIKQNMKYTSATNWLKKEIENLEEERIDLQKEREVILEKLVITEGSLKQCLLINEKK